MATQFQYSVTNDFPNQAVDLTVFQLEIEASSITATVEGVTINGDDVTIDFDTDLTVDEETTLDGVVAAHQGTGLVEGVQRAQANAEQTNATTTNATAVELQSGPLKAGDYLVSWYCEISMESDIDGSGIFCQVLWNGVERAFDSTAQSNYTSFSGAVVVPSNDLDAPALDIVFRRVGAANTARIRRCRVSISPLTNGNGE